MSSDRVESLAGWLGASAHLWPDRTAVVDPSGASITYAALNESADRIAGFLVSSGVRPGDRVGVVLPKGIAALTAMFGIMKARAAYVPADHTAPAARNQAILCDCAVRVVFLTSCGAGVLQDWPSATPLPAAAVFVDANAVTPPPVAAYSWDQAASHAPAHVADAVRGDLAYILYTSGSTGIPKGVTLTHENAISFVDWCSETFQPSPDDRFSSHAPFHFDLSVLDVYVAVKHGAALHVISEDLGKSPKALAEFISANRLTVWYSTPSILSLLAQFGDLDRHDCSSLRLVLFAGEVFPVKHLRQITRLWPWAAYYNLYGPTETNVCTFARIPLPVPDDRTTPYPIGWPCSHCVSAVLDDGRPVTPADEGLLYISGPSVFQGYWNRPEQNATLFLEGEGRRWYNTGDVVRLDRNDGFIYVGRRDRMVKRRGYRIELGEIERALYQHPAIAEAAVIGIPDEASGVRIVACLSVRAGERPTIVEMKTFSARHLPSYMSPDAFYFLESLPRTSTDKVDYQGLLRVAAGGRATVGAGR